MKQPLARPGCPAALKTLTVTALLLVGGVRLSAAAASASLANGGFESGLDHWRTWSRTAGALTATVDRESPHGGHAALRLDHRGDADWSLEPALRLEVQPGDLVELACWVQREGEGTATLCASTWNVRNEVVAWSSGDRTTFPVPGWQHLRTRIVVTSPITHVQPRLIGSGPATIWVDDFTVVRAGILLALRPVDLPRELTLTNAVLEVTFRTGDATLSVVRRPNGRRWTQQAFSGDTLVRQATLRDGRLRCDLLHAGTGLDSIATLALDADRPELLIELSAQGELPGILHFPHPFLGKPGDHLVLPMNEGISFPVEDPSVSPLHLVAYGGHGLCMAFFGITDGAAGLMAVLETPDDAAIRVDRRDGQLVIQPEWQAERGRFGYPRRLRYVIFDEGGHVAMAKRYRAHAQQRGLLKTLAEKRQANPHVDRLLGAVNVWCWDRDAVSLVRELQAAGIERILWSNRQPPGALKTLNDLGVLTSRYDIYQDVMAPTNFPRLQWIHPDWTTNAWPRDIILDRNGQWLRGWGVEARDGTLIPCGVICDRQALPYARERIPAELATHPYLCRFLDTTTAAPWHECHHPDHPMTRGESRRWKMELLRYVSEDCRLVTGSETGHDAAVPFLHYFEGMLSLGPYRVPDAGRRMREIWTNVPPAVARFQLGHAYRLPLWELVYHDCVVAQWYWGDYNNKLPALWDKRDLFNLLYGVPPMFMFDRQLWREHRDRFVQRYTNTCPHVRRVADQEMTNHRFLTPDRSVQQTVFANGITITVNFGPAEFRLPDGAVVGPLGYHVTDDP